MQPKDSAFTLTSRGERREQEQSTVSCRVRQVARRSQHSLVDERVWKLRGILARKRCCSAKIGGFCQDLALGGNEKRLGSELLVTPCMERLRPIVSSTLCFAHKTTFHVGIWLYSMALGLGLDAGHVITSLV